MLNFSEGSEIQRFFPPKIRWSPKKKKKRSSPILKLIYWPKSQIQRFFSPKIRWSPPPKKRSSPILRLIYRPKSQIQRFFSPKIRWSPKKKKKVFTDFLAEISNSKIFFAQNQVVSKKNKKVYTNFETGCSVQLGIPNV